MRRGTDVQSWRPEQSFKLTRVGVTDLVKPVEVTRPAGRVTLIPTIDVYVDLPAELKGSHLSRNVEALSECVLRNGDGTEEVRSLEDLCARLVRVLLERHPYATVAQAEARADYFLEREVYNGRKSLERYKLLARAEARRGPPVSVTKLVGVEVVGISACPCAMEGVREGIPVMSHNQRNISRLILEVPERTEVEANDLIDLVERELSAPTKELLKREDEARLVIDAHSNPKFVEDIVRDILRAVVARYGTLPDDTKVIVSSQSEESIHKHKAFAERVTTLGELKK
jgi:GTP cyclohydrolase-4